MPRLSPPNYRSGRIQIKTSVLWFSHLIDFFFYFLFPHKIAQEVEDLNDEDFGTASDKFDRENDEEPENEDEAFDELRDEENDRDAKELEEMNEEDEETGKSWSLNFVNKKTEFCLRFGDEIQVTMSMARVWNFSTHREETRERIV